MIDLVSDDDERKLPACNSDNDDDDASEWSGVCNWNNYESDDNESDDDDDSDYELDDSDSVGSNLVDWGSLLSENQDAINRTPPPIADLNDEEDLEAL